MAEDNPFQSFTSGLTSGADWAMKAHTVANDKLRLMDQMEEAKIQRELLNAKKGQMVFDKLADVISTPKGPFKKAKKESFLQLAQTLGVGVSSENLAALDDENAAMEIARAVAVIRGKPEEEQRQYFAALSNVMPHKDVVNLAKELYEADQKTLQTEMAFGKDMNKEFQEILESGALKGRPDLVEGFSSADPNRKMGAFKEARNLFAALKGDQAEVKIGNDRVQNIEPTIRRLGELGVTGFTDQDIIEARKGNPDILARMEEAIAAQVRKDKELEQQSKERQRSEDKNKSRDEIVKELNTKALKLDEDQTKINKAAALVASARDGGQAEKALIALNQVLTEGKESVLRDGDVQTARQAQGLFDSISRWTQSFKKEGKFLGDDAIRQLKQIAADANKVQNAFAKSSMNSIKERAATHWTGAIPPQQIFSTNQLRILGITGKKVPAQGVSGAVPPPKAKELPRIPPRAMQRLKAKPQFKTQDGKVDAAKLRKFLKDNGYSDFGV